MILRGKNKVLAQTPVPVSHFLQQTLQTLDTTMVVVVIVINITIIPLKPNDIYVCVYIYIYIYMTLVA